MDEDAAHDKQGRSVPNRGTSRGKSHGGRRGDLRKERIYRPGYVLIS